MDPYAVHALRLARSGAPQVIYDTETTGLDNAWEPRPKIWELGAIRRGPGLDRSAKNILVKIGMPIPPSANLRRVDPNLPDNEGWDARKVFTDFAKHIAGAILVGHNIVNFDNRLMAMAYAELELSIPIQFLDQRHCIDTLILAQRMFPRDAQNLPTNHKLVTMAQFLGITFNASDLHGALPDSVISEAIFDAMLSRFATGG